MTTNDLDQAREWAKSNLDKGHFAYGGRVMAAAHVIASLPDEWIDADKLREVIGRWDVLLADDDHEDMHGMLDELRALLPTQQPRPEDAPEPEPGQAWLIDYKGTHYEAVYWYSPLHAHWSFTTSREGLTTINSRDATPVSRLIPEGKA